MFGLKSIDDEWKMFMENGSCNAMKETVKDIYDIP